MNIKKLCGLAIITTEDVEHEITDKEIISASGIKNGNSTLFLNKNKIINNLEASFPYLKVLQIRITGARQVEFRLTARHEMFYYTTTDDGYFYILDDELKVLDRVVKTKDRVENLVEIKPSLSWLDDESQVKINSNILDINSATKPCSFLSKNYAKIFKSMYVAMYKSVLVNKDGSLWLDREQGSDLTQLFKDGEIRYFNWEDFNKVLTSVEFKTGYTLSGSYLRLVLNTKAGVQLDIGKPDVDLDAKINHCFSMVSCLDNDTDQTGQPNEITKSGSGRVVFGYDENGAEQKYYDAQNA